MYYYSPNNPNVAIIKETINSLILLKQNQLNIYSQVADELSKTVALAKSEALQDAIDILQANLLQSPPILPDNWGVQYG